MGADIIRMLIICKLARMSQAGVENARAERRVDLRAGRC
jgi:hypothetical protein